jgi:hypothetical protein
MTTYLLFNLGTHGERAMQDLSGRLSKEERVEAEILDADSPRGIQLAENYDVMGRPAVILVREDGSPVKIWQGADDMPAPSEIGYLTRQ